MTLDRLLGLIVSFLMFAGTCCGCDRDAAAQPHIVGEARLSFQGLPDGPAPWIFGPGPALLTTSRPDDAPTELRIVDGKLTNESTVPDGAASYYTSANLGGPVTKIGARWTFTPRGGTPGSMALVVSQTAFHPPFAVHLVITPNLWSFGVWPPTGELQGLAFERFDVPLKQDATQVYETQVLIDGDRADIALPDGQHKVVRDRRIADWAGSFATFEAYSDHGLTDSRVGFTDIWAESRRA